MSTIGMIESGRRRGAKAHVACRLSTGEEAHDATSAGWAPRVPQDRVRDVRIA